MLPCPAGLPGSMEKSLEPNCLWENKTAGQTRRRQKYYPKAFPLGWAAMEGGRNRALPGSCPHPLLQLRFSQRQGWDGSQRGPGQGALGLTRTSAARGRPGSLRAPAAAPGTQPAWSRSIRAHPDLEEPSAEPGRVQKAGLEGWAGGWRKQSLLIKMPLFVPSSKTGVPCSQQACSVGTRGAEKRDVRTKIAQSTARNYNSITVIIDLKGGSGGTWVSLCTLANDSHNLFVQQRWGVRAEAGGYFHGLAH